MKELLSSILTGCIIGWIAQLIAGQGFQGGIFRSLITGFAGAWLGSMLLGSFGPIAGGFAIIPALIGAVLFIIIVGLVMKAGSGHIKKSERH